MRFLISILFTSCLFWTQSQAHKFWTIDIIETIPDCSLTCVNTYVPQHCSSLTNSTSCYCNNLELIAVTAPCVRNACNVTEGIRFTRYSAQTCGTENDVSRVQYQLRTYYTLPVLTTLFVVIRLYSKYVFGALDKDDASMTGALLFYLAAAGAGLAMVLNGYGQHTFWLDVIHTQRSLRLFWIASMLYIVAITLTKLSLLLFFLQIFTTKRHPMIIYVIMGFIVVSNLTFLIGMAVQCNPIHGIWTNWMFKEAPIKCIDVFAVVYVQAGISILHNLLILIFPIPILWQLELSWRKKANLMIMFSVASFVLICSLCRLPTLLKMGTSIDPSFDQSPVALWTNLETAVGIMCACLPSCRSLVGYYFPNLKISLVDSTRHTSVAKETKGRPRSSTLKNPSSPYHTHKNGQPTGSVIELDSQRGRYREGSVNSESPINKDKSRDVDLFPSTGKGFGTSSRVDAEGDRKEWEHEGVIVTTSVEQNRESTQSSLKSVESVQIMLKV